MTLQSSETATNDYTFHDYDFFKLILFRNYPSASKSYQTKVNSYRPLFNMIVLASLWQMVASGCSTMRAAWDGF